MTFLKTHTQGLRDLLSSKPAQSPPINKEEFPKLTIITPSYNQADFLERTILSILNQGYPNLEYMIIDGGSTDHSVEVIRKYEKYLAYWVSEKDKGQVDAINKGLARATGDYIAFQNSDDVYFPGTLIRFGKAAIQKADDILFGDLFMIDTDDEVIELLKTTSYSLRCQLLEGMQIHNQSLFFKKKLVDLYGPFDPKYRFAFDYEFILRYTIHEQASVRKVDGLAGALRIHADAKSSTIATVGVSEHEQIKKTYLDMSSVAPSKLNYLWCRIRKILYFAGSFDFKYILYRTSK
ncbi:glycosyltransferase family 2 protein [Dyadobacter tibetensis]|uniref:glycosyltransferase family 2 protein n=1 Tax=Dyadobacter tibetensis TaxID=1211851 RepID=UPI00046FBD06|nr:glycosyltransferase family 2 protein [Dyadobacter tibetensis]